MYTPSIHEFPHFSIKLLITYPKKNSGPTIYIEQITHYQIREMQIIAKSFPRV
jgi:hypothetical protein